MDRSSYWDSLLRRPLSRRTVIRSGAALAVLGLAGCQPSAGGQSSTGGSTQPADGIKRGGVLNTTWPGDPANFDIQRGPNSAENFMHLTYDRLLQFKRGGSGPGKSSLDPAPMLAASWEQPDPTTFIFKLNQGAKFHNKAPVNGREATAEDVVYSIKRVQADEPGNGFRDLFTAINRVEAVDKYTVKLTTSEPFVPILSFLAHTSASIVAKEVVDAKGNLQTEVIGTGPYILDKFTKGNVYTYKKHPEYYVKGFPYLDEINIFAIVDYAAAGTALRSKQLDYLYFARPNAGDEYVKSTPELQTFRWPAGSASGYSVNLKKKPFDDPKVRQALALSWDPDAVGVATSGQGGYKLFGFLPDAFGTDMVVPRTDLPFARRDLARARQLLAEAGVAQGTKWEFDAGNFPLGKTVGEVLQQSWKEVGIDLQVIVQPDRAAQLAYIGRGAWDISSLTYTTSSSPPIEADEVVSAYHSKSSANYAGRGTAELDRLIDEQRRTSDRTRRIAILKDIQKKIADEAWTVVGPAINYYALWWPYVKNYEHSYGKGFVGAMEFCWVDK